MFVKRILFLVAISVVCTFAQNPAPVAPAHTPLADSTIAAHATVPVAVPAPLADSTAAAPVAESIATPAPLADSTIIAPAPVTASTPAAPAPEAPAAPPAKEAIIENPIEFAIVSAIFIATVLLIALTGN